MPTSINIADETVELMGDGVAIVMQKDQTQRGHPMQNVVLTVADLRAMLSAAEG